MSRQRLGVGELGKITPRERGNGRWQASLLVRKADGSMLTLSATDSSPDAVVRAIEGKRDVAFGRRTTRQLRESATLQEVVESWLVYKTTAQPQSMVRYRTDAAAIVTAFGSAAVLRDLRADDIDGWLLGLIHEGLTSAARRLQKRFRSIVAHAGSRGVDVGHLTRTLVKVPKAGKRESALTAEAWTDVLAALEDWAGGRRHGGRKVDWERLRDVLTLCLVLGARVGEVLALKPSDIVGTHVSITATQVYVPGKGPVRQEHTKGRDRRAIPVSQDVLELISRRSSMGSGAWVIEGAPGKMLAEDGLQRAMRAFRDASPELLRALGIPAEEFTTHLMRRSAATHVERHGGLELASSMLGHASEAITRAAYVRTREHVRAEVAGMMSDFDVQ